MQQTLVDQPRIAVGRLLRTHARVSASGGRRAGLSHLEDDDVAGHALERLRAARGARAVSSARVACVCGARVACGNEGNGGERRDF
jgi:hypothetical protein